MLISFLVLASCVAQKAGDKISKTSVVIYNDADNDVSFLLGETSKMDTFNVKENDVWFSPSFSFNPIIKLQTQSHILLYELRLGNYYMIYWNADKKYWDIKKTKKRR